MVLFQLSNHFFRIFDSFCNIFHTYISLSLQYFVYIYHKQKINCNSDDSVHENLLEIEEHYDHYEFLSLEG